MTKEKFIENVEELATKMGVEYENKDDVLYVGCVRIYCFEHNMALWETNLEIGVYYKNIKSMHAARRKINLCVNNLTYFNIVVKEA